MSYVASTLGQHERVLFRTGYHWLVWVGCALLVIPALGLAAGAYPFSALDVTLLVLSLIPAPVGVYYFARAMLVEIVVTNERFVYKTGLIAFRTEEIALDNIETIKIKQSIPGRLLRYGTITVRGTGSEFIKIRLVNDPISLRRHIPMAQGAVDEGAAEVAA
jgi:uncharacterized membrane protein YdbT with pleckstrin-like domain